MEHDTTARKLCRLAHLDDETLTKIVALGLVPARRRPRTGWLTYDADALLPCLIAGAYTRLGAAAVDSASLLLHIASLPESDRADFAERVALVKHIPSSRIDYYIESEIPLYPGAQPLVYPLRKLIELPR